MKQNNKISSKFDKSFIKFVLKLTLYMSVYYIFIGFKFSQIITDFLAHTTAIKSNYLLNLFNFNTRYIESVIFGDTFSIKVAFGCEGSEPLALFIATLLSIKASLKMKSIGILIGSVILTFWNDIRVFLLYVIGNNHNSLFEIMHDDIFPLLSILLSLTLFYVWLTLNKKYS